jgi:hypothetical protein
MRIRKQENVRFANARISDEDDLFGGHYRYNTHENTKTRLEKIIVVAAFGHEEKCEVVVENEQGVACCCCVGCG